MSSTDALPDGVSVTLPLGLVPRELAQAVVAAAWSHLRRHGGDDAGFFVEVVPDEYPELDSIDEEALLGAFDAVVAARRHYLAEREAAGVGSNIEVAFSELERVGVVARGDFSCCGTCASAEIWQEMSEDTVGYVTFNHQDAETIVESGTTYLSYGYNLARDLPEEAWEALSQDQQSERYLGAVTAMIDTTVKPIVEKHGLTLTWDGRLETRVLIEGITDYELAVE